jgi:methionyl aminopeptidase
MPKPPVTTRADADGAFAAAQCVVKTHQRLAEFLREGMRLPQIDQFIARTLEELGCRSAFYGYRLAKTPAFPSYACLSLNNCVVHGTAGSVERPLQPGDVLKIDIGVVHRAWIGDAAWTYVFKEMSPEIKRLTDCGKAALAAGVQELHPRSTYLAWARTVQRIVEGRPADGGYGFHLVRGLGGHGYGRYENDRKRGLHGPPFVSNVVPTNPYDWPDAHLRCEPGMLLAVEPMIAIGTGEVRQRGREWPVYTADGSTSVHYEHDVLVTPEGPRILTEGMEQLPDIVG